MGVKMYCISVSHKTTPAEIRQLFSFSVEEQKNFSNKLLFEKKVNGCIIVSTCNRSEIYFTGKAEYIDYVEEAISEFKGIVQRDIKKHYMIYSGKKAVRHLFKVACGLDSMVLGEDEILRQVKEAYLYSLDIGHTNSELNIIFQGAFNYSKKIKTTTKLSKTSVSIGTLTANKVLDFVKENAGYKSCVLLVGAGGKIGSIVAKNMLDKGIEVIGTSRKHNNENSAIANVRLKMVDFDRRYQYISQINVIISATASPHYTFTYDELSCSLDSKKKYMVIDLAVPYDVDKKIGSLNNVELFDIDYFKCASKENSNIKLEELEKAELLLEECVEDTLKKMYLREFKWDDNYVHEEWFDKMIYYLKESLDSDHFKCVLDNIKKARKGET